MVRTRARFYPAMPSVPEGEEEEHFTPPLAYLHGLGGPRAQDDDEVRITNLSLPRDASKLPVFKGDNNDAAHVDTFLRSLRRYFKVNARSYAVDPDDELKLSTCGNCFPFDSIARVWFDSVEDEFTSFEEFEDALRAEFAAGCENLVRLQQTWEHARQGKYGARDFYSFLTKLRMRISAIDSAEKPSDREFLRKYCTSLNEPARGVIAKKRITEPNLTLPAIVQLAELEDKSTVQIAAALRALQLKSQGGQPAGTLTQLTGTSKYCYFCKKRGHTPEECRKIAAKKAAGLWKERVASQT